MIRMCSRHELMKFRHGRPVTSSREHDASTGPEHIPVCYSGNTQKRIRLCKLEIAPFLAHCSTWLRSLTNRSMALKTSLGLPSSQVRKRHGASRRTLYILQDDVPNKKNSPIGHHDLYLT